jgi:hypothetical protein
MPAQAVVQSRCFRQRTVTQWVIRVPCPAHRAVQHLPIDLDTSLARPNV